MSIDVSTVTEDEWPQARRVDELAFGYTITPTREAAARRLLELDRTLLARLDGQVAGMATAYTQRLSVPGGELAAAGVSWVGVTPTLRRRGVLSALMRAQIDDVAARGEPLAVLWASEPAIYPRFGYGMAAAGMRVVVHRGHADLQAPPATLATRIVEPTDGREAVAAVFEAVRTRRPGVAARTEAWWDRLLVVAEEDRRGYSERRLLLVHDGDTPVGYAVYSTRSDMTAEGPTGDCAVAEVGSVSVAAHATAWRVLLSLDLVATTTAWHLPVDDPLLTWLVDPWAARPTLHDGMWLRLVDLPAAFAGRTYSQEVDVVVDVRDDYCAWNTGRWRLAGGPAGATCAPSADPADLTLAVTELATTYLGGGSLAERAAAGRVEEHTRGAVAVLDRALRHHPAPHSPQVF